MRKQGGPVVFSPEEEKKIAWLFTRYPTKTAVCIPLLWMVQEKYGWVPEEAVEVIARYCNVPPSHVYSVVSFYTMFNRAPIGKAHLQLCTNLSCQLMGSEHMLDCLRKKLGIELGQTTPDGMFTLSEVECLAACEMAPMIQVNDEFVGPLDEKGLDDLLGRLRAGGKW